MRYDYSSATWKPLPAISSLRLHKSLANYLEIQKPNSTFSRMWKRQKGKRRKRWRRQPFCQLWVIFFSAGMFSPPLAVVVGLKAYWVAEAGNDVGWGVYMAHSAREEAFLLPSFSTKFLLTAAATTVCFKQRCSHVEARHVLQKTIRFRVLLCCAWKRVIDSAVHNTLIKLRIHY